MALRKKQQPEAVDKPSPNPPHQKTNYLKMQNEIVELSLRERDKARGGGRKVGGGGRRTRRKRRAGRKIAAARPVLSVTFSRPCARSNLPAVNRARTV